MQLSYQNTLLNISPLKNYKSGPDAKRYMMLWGGYGGGNVGDYITLDAAITQVGQQFSDKQILILDLQNPALTQSLFPHIRVITDAGLVGYGPSVRAKLAYKLALKRLNQLANPTAWLPPMALLPQWVQCLNQSACMLLVGGGYLNDIYDLNSYLQPINVANRLQVPIITAPLGIGPFTHEANRQQVIQALRLAQVQVRDEKSAQWLAPAVQATVTQDHGVQWVLQQWPQPVKRQWLPGKPLRIGVCAFAEGTQKHLFIEWWKTLRPELESEYKCQWFPFNFDFRENEEDQLHRSFWPEFCAIKPTTDSFQLPIASLREVDLVVTGRFHSVIIANGFGVPCLAVYGSPYYESKLIPLAKSGKCITAHFNTLTGNGLHQRINTLLQSTYAESR
jgi:polysaccharide pyruvyl transferase WcaK-like protein